MGEKVYVGGGVSEDEYGIFQYNTSRDEWSRLPPHHVFGFAMAQFTGHLITVGGLIPGSGSTGMLYRFKEESQEWEFLKPMPTARSLLNVATTQSAVIAIGGVTDVRDDGNPVVCATVEVYSSETSQWYTADCLPVPCLMVSSVTIAGTCYLLRRGDADCKPVATVLYASLVSLIQKATSPTRQSPSDTSIWKTLPDTPLKASTAASLSGNLLAVGGEDIDNTSFPGINVFFPLTNSWVRITTGDLPEPQVGYTAVQLSSNTMIVIGGKDNQDKHTKTVFMGTITV